MHALIEVESAMQALITRVIKAIDDPHIVAYDVTALHRMAGTNQPILTGSFDLWYEDPGQIEERLVSVTCDSHGISGFNFDPNFFIAGEHSIQLDQNLINVLSNEVTHHV